MRWIPVDAFGAILALAALAAAILALLRMPICEEFKLGASPDCGPPPVPRRAAPCLGPFSAAAAIGDRGMIVPCK